MFELQAYFELFAGTCTVLLLLKMFNDLRMPNIDALQANDDSHIPSYYQRHCVSGGARAQLRHSLLTLTDPGLTPPTTLLSPTPKPSNLSQQTTGFYIPDKQLRKYH